MRRRLVVTGLVWLAIAAGINGCVGPDAGAPAEAAAPENATAAVAAQEGAAVGQDSVVAYESTSHGALQVMSVRDDPTDWFDVLQDGERAYAGNPYLLNRTMELLPGSYEVDVNRTRRAVTIEAGKKTVIWTGELRVEGGPSGAYWWPMQGNERKLSSNPATLNASRALLPGTYEVFVHVSVTTGDTSLGDAEVRAGQTTVLQH